MSSTTIQTARRNTFLVSALLLILLTCGASAQQTIIQTKMTDPVGTQAARTDWTKSLTFDKFNPALGTLTGVTLQLEVSVQTSGMIQNPNPFPASISYTMEVGLNASIGSITPQTQAGVSGGPVTLPPDGMLILDPVISRSSTGLEYDDLATLTTFTGNGTITLTGQTLTNASVTGPGNLLSVFQVSAQMAVTLTYQYRPVADAVVSGVVTLEGCVNPAGQTVTFLLRPTDGSPVLTRTATLTGSGAFQLTGLPHTAYQVAVKAPLWLQKVVPVDTTNGNVTNVAVTLPAGDANNDNRIDIGDFAILVPAFETVLGGPNYNANADFNCDNRIDLGDFGLLVNNFETVGDP